MSKKYLRKRAPAKNTRNIKYESSEKKCRHYSFGFLVGD